MALHADLRTRRKISAQRRQNRIIFLVQNTTLLRFAIDGELFFARGALEQIRLQEFSSPRQGLSFHRATHDWIPPYFQRGISP